MKVSKKRIDKVSIERATNTAKDITLSYIKKLEALQKDVSKKERKEQCKCKLCFYFYNNRIGGAVITEINCGLCDCKMRFGSTDVDPICLSCALKNELCVRCGGDVDMKNKRKPRSYENY
jgi:hypothetical protein